MAHQDRHYGMDWLRIGAFAVLIFYHVGLVFVPWNYHVNAPDPVEWGLLPMLVPSAWRLMLLFVVSGYASRALFAKHGGRAGPFLRNRTLRLVVPLVAGTLVITPPQLWAELVVKHGYAQGYGWFWLHDYFDFRRIAGLFVPNWQHLWFVAYLWVYTMGLGIALALLPGQRFQHWFDRVFSTPWGLALPILWLFAVRLWLVPAQGETHEFLNDAPAHLPYLPAFLFGFGLRGSLGAMHAIARWWKVAALLALAGMAGVLAIQTQYLHAPAPEWVMQWFRGFRAVQAWASVIALIGIATRFGNHDHRWRPMLTEAVFPFYIIHQTVIVVGAMWLVHSAVPMGAQFALLSAATIVGCWLFYLIGRRVRWLRPLIGLRSVPPRADDRAAAIV